MGAARACSLARRRRFLYQSGHDQIFWYDEWAFLLGRRGGDLATYLEPHNEHLSLVPIAIYKLLLGATGMDGYGPYRLTLVVLDLLCALLLFVYAERRVGGWLALGAAALLPLPGPGLGGDPVAVPDRLGDRPGGRARGAPDARPRRPGR